MHVDSHRSRHLIGVLFVAAALTGACASAPRRAGTVPVPRPFPMGPTVGAPSPPDEPDAPVGADDSPSVPAGDDAYAVVGTALGFRGTPYRNGGADPAGFDCSGFTQYVFARYGVALPREVSDQYQVGTPIEPRDLQPGDLIFFTTVSPGASHVAIAVGGDQFVHAPSSRGVVRVERLDSSVLGSAFSRRATGHRCALVERIG